MKTTILFVFCVFVLLVINTQAQDYDRFSGGVFSYPKGKYNDIPEVKIIILLIFFMVIGVKKIPRD